MKTINKISKLFEKMGNSYCDLCHRIGSVVSPF